MSKETMLQFIEENKAVYGGKMNLAAIAEADEKTIAKAYRNIKTKIWSMGRKQAQAVDFAPVEAIETLEQLAAMRQAAEGYIAALASREAEIRAAQKTLLEAQIAELQAKLETL